MGVHWPGSTSVPQGHSPSPAPGQAAALPLGQLRGVLWASCQAPSPEPAPPGPGVPLLTWGAHPPAGALSP